MIPIRLPTLAALAASLVLGAAARADAPAPRQAVFLVVVDTLRADRLSSYGYSGHATPHLDALAARGLRFDSAQAASSWTTPSMAALMTSLYPRQLGILERPARSGRHFQWNERRSHLVLEIPRRATTLAEHMRARGYRTAAFVDQPALNASTSFARGFDEYRYSSADGGARLLGEESSGALQPWAAAKDSASADAALVDAFQAWLAAHAGQRVFVWIHLLAPHVPYAPPPDFAPAGERTISALYDGEVRFVDSLVGRISAAIERLAGWDRSLVVFASDHGEELDDRGHRGHGHSLHREVTRVPLVVVAPGRIAPGVVSAPVRLLDVAPTILALSGGSAPLPSGLEGRSLEAADLDEAEAPAVFIEGKLYGESEQSLLAGGYKLIVSRGEEPPHLYRVGLDPAELHDLAAREGRRVEAMEREIDAIARRLQQDFMAARTLPAAPAQDDDTPRMREALRALGYLGDAEAR